VDPTALAADSVDSCPNEAGTLANLYPHGNYPPYRLGEWIAECEQTGVDVRVNDPQTVNVRPLPPGSMSFG
jgi:hypothetical protein